MLWLYHPQAFDNVPQIRRCILTKPLAKTDNFWLCMDAPTNLMVITAFMEFSVPLDFGRLQTAIANRLASFPRFKQRISRSFVGLGSARWQDDPTYDLRSHLLRVALPNPGKEAQLKEMMSNLIATPLDLAKPPWQIHLIENYGCGCVLFFRIHHCIADGIALIHVLLSMTDTQADAPGAKTRADDSQASKTFLFPPLTPVIRQLKRAQAAAQSIGQTVKQEMEKIVSYPPHVIEMAKFTSDMTSDVFGVLSKLALMPSDPNTAFKGRLGVRKTVAWSRPMALKKIKTIGKAFDGATLNDVLIAIATGAMRRYLKAKGTRVNNLDLRMMVPVNIRKPGTEFELGNKFSLVVLALPVYISDTTLRLKEIKRRMDHLKISPDAIVGYSLLNFLGMLPFNAAKNAALILANKVSGVLTNVPGPRQPLFFAGKEIKNMMFWVPRIGNIGLGLSIFSYNGHVTLGVAADEKRMPDPAALIQGFEKEMAHLLQLVESGKLFEDSLAINDRHLETIAKTTVEPQETPNNQCQAVTQKGTRCKNRARTNARHCRLHQKAADQKPPNLNGVDTKETIQADIAKSLADII
jgi:diacylglycerol O-acyltransferase